METEEVYTTSVGNREDNKFVVYNAGRKEMHHLSNSAPLEKWVTFREQGISG